jgi:hypothetical protein
MDPESSHLLEISEVLVEDENLDELLGLEAVDSIHLAGDNEEDIQRFLEELVVTEDAAPLNSSDTVPKEQLSPTSFLNRLTGVSIASSASAEALSPTIVRESSGVESTTAASPPAPTMSMSPTTLLDSLLSTTNPRADDPVRSIMTPTAVEARTIVAFQEVSVEMALKFPPAPPLSRESVELSSLQELVQVAPSAESNPEAIDSRHNSDDNFVESCRMETSGDNSFFGSVKDDGLPVFEMMSGAEFGEDNEALFVIGDDDEEGEEDGLNSFMTAMEDASSFVSKTSTTGTMETATSIAADVTLEPNEKAAAPPERELRIDACSKTATPHLPIQATVSFAQSLEEHVASDPIHFQDIPAPLSPEDDPTTPKRSGREPLVVSMDNRPPLLGERGGLVQEEVSTSTDALSPSAAPANAETSSMGDATLPQPESYNQNVDSERKLDTLYDISSVLDSIVPLTLSSDQDTPGAIVSSQEKLDLSVPSLLDDVTPSPIALKNFQRNDFDAVMTFNGDEVISSVGIYLVSGSDSPSVEEIPILSLENVDPKPLKNTSILHTETSERDILDEPVVPRVLENEIIEVMRKNSDPSNPLEPVASTDDLLTKQQGTLDVERLEASAGVRLNHEIKSLLQVEFPSVLENGNKKSDVSLSSASSTISHGSYSKARASSSNITAPTKTEDKLKRRKSNGGSLPPRSPASRNDQNDPTDTRAFAASVSKKLSLVEVVRRDDTDLERGVESKWIKQSLALHFNPKKSIFAGKLDKKKNSTDSISSPGSPPEPCFESDPDYEYDSSNDGSDNSSTVSNEIGIKESGLWDMITDIGLMEQNDTNQLQYVASVDTRGPSLGQAVSRADDSVTASSLAPSESEVNNINKLSTKPSFKSDASFSSTAMKGRTNNVALSFSQHSRGSLCSRRSRDDRQESRGSKSFISPAGKSGQFIKPSTRLELDSASVGRVTLKATKSPNRTALPTTHCSSPDLLQLNEETRQSQLPTPIEISLHDNGLTMPYRSDRPLIADALPSDILSPESPVERYANLLNDTEVIRDQDAALLQEEWLSFSSISPIDLPFRYSNSFAPLKFVGSLLWRQLISCWKHAEITRTMLTCGMFSQVDYDMQYSETRSINRSVTSSQRGRRSSAHSLKLNGVNQRQKMTGSDTRISNGFDVDRKNFSLSTFLTQINCEPSSPSSEILRHEVTSSGSNKVLIEDLLESAQSSLQELSLLVKDVIAFSSMGTLCPHDSEVIRFSLGMKDADSIGRKAERKYQGDFLQVKDILRAHIVFRNEGALVCGLVRLLQTTKRSDSDGDKPFGGFVLVRMKNLFAAGSCIGTLRPSPLPTGYRHVLLNFRLKNGLLVGKSRVSWLRNW